MPKRKKTHYQKVKGLLNKYKEEGVEHIEDKGQFPQKQERFIDCEICENFDSKKNFCNTYDIKPFRYKIPMEEFCNEFTLDKIKEMKERDFLLLRRITWDRLWGGKEMGKIDSKSYSIYSPEELEKLAESSEKFVEDSKINYSSSEESEDLDNLDIVYAHNNKKLGRNNDPLRKEELVEEKTRKEDLTPK